jgi:hypothetical protein
MAGFDFTGLYEGVDSVAAQLAKELPSPSDLAHLTHCLIRTQTLS